MAIAYVNFYAKRAQCADTMTTKQLQTNRKIIAKMFATLLQIYGKTLV
jgi:hypothetical protein